MNTNLSRNAGPGALLLGRARRALLGAVTAAGVALALGAGVALPPPAARADATTFSNTKRQYKVGVLLLDSTIDANLDSVVSPAEAAQGPENTDPHVFFIADSLSEVKPQNWDLVNPLAPPTVTAEIYNRWSIPGGRDPGNPYQLGQKVTKNMAAYWEVRLSSVNEADLIKFDLLFITHHRRFRLSSAEREKLRKAVDAGAILWVEDCGNMRTVPSAPFFLEDLQFNGGFGGGGGGPVVYQPNHPILNTPYRLSFPEIANLGDKNYGNFFLVTERPVGGVQNLSPNPEVLTTVVGNSAGTDAVTGRALPYIAAGNYGSGAIVVTAGDSGCDINDYAGGVNVGAGGNSGAFCGPNLRTAHSEDLKFLYNLIAWGSSNNTYRRNFRRTGANFDGVNAPLVAGFDFTNAPATSQVNSRSAPLISKGIMYVSGLNAANQITVRAYDIQPFRDYDADGNPDDGWGDLNAGYAFDEIWRWEGPATAGNLQPSGPTLTTLLDGTGNQVEVLLVTLPDGTLVALNPLPFVAGTRSLNPNNTPVAINAALGGGTYAASVSGVAPSPVLFENKIYVVQPNGTIRCVNGANVAGDPLWVSTAMAAPPALNPTGSPSLGAVRLTVRGTIADNSNGTTNDIVLYAPVEDASGANLAGKILPFWLGTRNEVHKEQPGGIVRTRVAGAERDKYFIAPGGPGTGFIVPRARVFADEDPDGGGPLPAASREENYANGWVSPNFTAVWRAATANGSYFGGEVEIRDAGGALINPAVTKVLVSVDYDLVYAPVGAGAGSPPAQLQNTVVVRGGLTNPSTLIPGYGGGLDTVAVAPNDLLVYGAIQADLVSGSGARFSTIFGLNEQEFATGGSRLRWRFPLHPGTGAGSVEIGGVGVVEAPALRNRLQFTSATQANFYVPPTANDPDYEPLVNAEIVGAPVVTNEGLTYALARATSQLNGGLVTVVMAFRTNPDITLTLPEAFEPGTVQVSQLNMLTYAAGSTTGDTISVAVDANQNRTGTQFVSDPSRGRITIVGFQPPNGGPAFSASQSFVVRYTPAGGTSPKTVVLPPTPTIPTADDNLIQQIVNPNDATPRQGAGGFSPLLWHYVLPGTPLSGLTLIGDQLYFTRRIGGAPAAEVVAVDSRPQENDATVRLGSGEQVYGVVNQITLPSGQVRPVSINHVAWARSIPVAVPEAPLVGNEGTLAVNTSGGTFAFQEALTLVADSKRLMEVAADGSPVWVVDSTLREETVGGAGPVFDRNGNIENPNDTGRFLQERKPFAKPQMARKLSNSDYLVADTGNNRVVRIDRSGKIQWSVERAQDPHGILAAGDPTTLNGPTDVQFYQVRKYLDADNVPDIYEDHYVIADAGNYRVLEVVDYRTQNGQFLQIPDTRSTTGGTVPGQGIVVWTTRTGSKQGRQLRYQGLRVFPGADPADGAFGKPTLVAAVANTTAAGPNATLGNDFTGGSLVELDYNPYDTPFYMSDAAGNPAGGVNPRVYWPNGGPEPQNNGLIKTSIGEIVIRQGANVRIKRIARPTYFERVFRRVAGNLTPIYLICDAEGVYACVETVAGGRTVFEAVFKMEQADYNAMNLTRMVFTDTAGNGVVPAPASLPKFVPTSVKLLANGNYLITNSATGPSEWFRNGKFTGEAFEVEPVPLTLGTTVTWLRFGDFSVPRLDRVVLRAGVGALGIQTNEQKMGNRGNTDLTEQPLSSDRL